MALNLTNVFPPTRSIAPGRLRRWCIRAMGTQCEVQYAAEDPMVAAAFEKAADHWITRFESRCTRFTNNSIIGRINATAGNGEWHEIDAEMEEFINICESLYTLTDGVLDATAGPLARLWDYHVANPRVPSESEVTAARCLVGWGKVERAPGRVRLPARGMMLDFGGWGKEFAVDAVARIAREHGLTSVLVDFGHDVFAGDAPPGRSAWQIGLEDPLRPGTSSGCIALVRRGVASSGDYLRGFTIEGKRYGHIIDPRTGWPVSNGCRQVTVVAPSCLQAGVFATTAFILGPHDGIRLVSEAMDVEARIVTHEAMYQTRGFFHHVVS